MLAFYLDGLLAECLLWAQEVPAHVLVPITQVSSHRRPSGRRAIFLMVWNLEPYSAFHVPSVSMKFGPHQGHVGVFFGEDRHIRVRHLGSDTLKICLPQREDVPDHVSVIVLAHDDSRFFVRVHFRQAGDIDKKSILDRDEPGIYDLSSVSRVLGARNSRCACHSRWPRHLYLSAMTRG